MRQIALLRGVNVGGRNKLPMKSFVSALEALGCKNVATYIQSGNAVFDGSPTPKDIAEALRKVAGFAPHVFVTGATAFKRIARANPFVTQAQANGKSVHLFLLDAAPSADRVKALADIKHPTEDFAVAGGALYLFTPSGLAQSKIAERIDRVLGAVTTARNWNTVEKLVQLAERP